MKVVLLVPAFMKENTRKYNFIGMNYAKEHYPVDEIIVNDQGFDETDYLPGFTYIGHHKEGQGFAKARNQLLEYFYNSDADYAIWLDANSRIGNSSLNDFYTLVNALKSGKVQIDVIFSTLGIHISSERITAKKMKDFKDNIYLVNFATGYDYMHGLVIKNFKKYYGITPYIDMRCDPRKGTSEDIYFARLLRKMFDYRLLPTIVVAKPSNKASTWVANQSGYKYPKPDYNTIDAYVDEYLKSHQVLHRSEMNKTIIVPREEKYKELIKGYKPRPKVKSKGLLKE